MASFVMNDGMTDTRPPLLSPTAVRGMVEESLAGIGLDHLTVSSIDDVDGITMRVTVCEPDGVVFAVYDVDRERGGILFVR